MSIGPNTDILAAERDALAAQLTEIRRKAQAGGKARWKGATKAQRSEAMRQAVNARWARKETPCGVCHNPIKNENG